jgi:CxxC motif-containing protein (DUF1111 family)
MSGKARRGARLLLSLLAAASLAGSRCAAPPRPGDPLPGLNPAQLALFESGRKVFERKFTPETGLGPLFNAPSCGECHEDPASGGTGDEMEVHVALVRPDGSCDPLADRGGPVIQQHVTPALQAALGIESEPVPSEASARGGRSTPDLFGFGLLDAVPDSEILARSDPDDRDGDGISGRPNRFFDGRLGRFGRKALVPTLREFTEGAFVVEQGITNPAMPAEETVGGNPLPAGVDPVADPEIDQPTVDAADAFVRFLAPPAPQEPGRAAEHGRRVFARIGCASCHVPALKTGKNPVRALSYRKVEAYTDLLLHDMGPDLADICLGLATPSEFRTEPLMGLHLMRRFLHDGRAATIDEAILLHAGEAKDARERYRALPEADRAALAKFLAGL